MNRKKKAKVATAKAKVINSLHPFNDPLEWLKGDAVCPWTDKQIAEYQKKLDSAFGAENAFVLAWSYDRKYWDEIFMEDWDVHGEPIGRPQKIPMLLFKQHWVNDKDYLFISTPRFLLLEILHGSQMEDSWEAGAYEDDGSFLGGRKRIRTKKPPLHFYRVARTIAHHEQGTAEGMRPCCQRMWDAGKSICYGKYRPPADDDILFIRRMRENLDKWGIAQRNDAPRDPKVLALASASTKHFMDVARRRRRSAVQEMIMSDPKQFMGDIFKNYGITMNATEIDRTLKEGFKRQDEKEQI